MAFLLVSSFGLVELPQSVAVFTQKTALEGFQNTSASDSRLEYSKGPMRLTAYSKVGLVWQVVIEVPIVNPKEMATYISKITGMGEKNAAIESLIKRHIQSQPNFDLIEIPDPTNKHRIAILREDRGFSLLITGQMPPMSAVEIDQLSAWAYANQLVKTIAVLDAEKVNLDGLASCMNKRLAFRGLPPRLPKSTKTCSIRRVGDRFEITVESTTGEVIRNNY